MTPTNAPPASALAVIGRWAVVRPDPDGMFWVFDVRTQKLRHRTAFYDVAANLACMLHRKGTLQ